MLLALRRQTPWIEFDGVLTHERMFACASTGFRSSRTKKSGCPLTFLVVTGVLCSGASGHGSHARVRHGPRGSDKPRLLGASLHDAGGRRYASRVPRQIAPA